MPSSQAAYSKLCSRSRLQSSPGAQRATMKEMNHLQKFIAFLIGSMGSGDIQLKRAKPNVVLFLRKSKSGSTQTVEPMTYQAQQDAIKSFCKMKFKHYRVVATIKSRESGVALHRPILQRAIALCFKEQAALMLAKVDRLARLISIFDAMLLANIPMFFAEFPTMDLRKVTLAERSAIMRAALESHLEGLRVSERIATVMPIVKRKGKKMGGRAHDKGSKKRKANALAEAKRVKPKILKYMRKDKFWSAPKVATNLNDSGVTTDNGKQFTPRVVKSHMMKLKLFKAGGNPNR